MNAKSLPVSRPGESAPGAFAESGEPARLAGVAGATRLKAAGRTLPQVHAIAKNRLTQYMGPSSAYAAVLRSIDQDVSKLLKSNSEIFTFAKTKQGVVDIRDFQTTGVVAFARGCPFYRLASGRLDVMGQRIQVNEPQRQLAVNAIEQLVALF
jgi:hypothetical protein